MANLGFTAKTYDPLAEKLKMLNNAPKVTAGPKILTPATDTPQPMPETSARTSQPTPSQPTGEKMGFFDALALGMGGLGGASSQNLQKMALAKQQRIAETEKAQAEKQKAAVLRNRTVEELIKRGRKDLAGLVQNGMMSATDAVKELTKQVKGTEFQGNLINPYTGEIIAEGKGAGYLDPKEQLSALNVLRDDLRNDLGEFNATQSAWNKISYLYENQSGTADYALTVAFANILDPGSVVRGEEQEAIARSGALSEAMKEQLANVLTGGGTLPPKVRDDILNIAKNQYSDKLKDARSTYDHYTKLASNYGLDPSYLYSGSMEDPTTNTLALTPAIISSVKASDPTATDEEIAEWWGSLTPEQKKAQSEKVGR